MFETVYYNSHRLMYGLWLMAAIITVFTFFSALITKEENKKNLDNCVSKEVVLSGETRTVYRCNFGESLFGNDVIDWRIKDEDK